MHHEVPPGIDQLEAHPFDQQIQAHSFLQDNGIQHESWRPFAEGRRPLSKRGLQVSIASATDDPSLK